MAMGAIDECKDDGRFRWSVIRVHPPPPASPCSDREVADIEIYQK